MDACRTALRLGAKEVYNIYRVEPKAGNALPAGAIEIGEAEEEGVIFEEPDQPHRNHQRRRRPDRQNPAQENGSVEPDASSRRSRTD